VPATPATASRTGLPPPEFATEASGVNHAYKGQNGWVQALENFEIPIARNEFLCLFGPSACGKSSFLPIVTSLMKPLEGEVHLNGKRIEEPGLDRGWLFQESALFPWLTALGNVAFGLVLQASRRCRLPDRQALRRKFRCKSLDADVIAFQEIRA
jgi:ABC-type taurine transport system ATPase subunit